MASSLKIPRRRLPWTAGRHARPSKVAIPAPDRPVLTKVELINIEEGVYIGSYSCDGFFCPAIEEELHNLTLL